MEMTAVIEALEALKRSCRIVIHTDSTYVMKGMTEWMENWKRRGWKTADKKPVKNVDLWQRLDEAMARLEHLRTHGPSAHAFGWAELEQAEMWRSHGCSPVAAE